MSTLRAPYLIWVGLLCLLAITAASSRFDLGWGNVTINLAIATLKAVLILIFFMGLRASPALPRLAVGAMTLWLGIMYVLVLTDYLSR